MARIIQDTKTIKEYGKQLVSLTDKYDKAITSFFDKVMLVKGYWRGEDADMFISGMKKEKQLYSDFGLKISKLGKEMQKSSGEIETLAIEVLKS